MSKKIRKKKGEKPVEDETLVTEEASAEVTTNAEAQPSEATEETEAEASTSEETAPEEPVKEPPKKLSKGMVEVKVLIGTLQFEDGSYEKGETFTVSKKRAALFDPKDIEIL